MRYINLRVTYLLTYLLTCGCVNRTLLVLRTLQTPSRVHLLVLVAFSSSGFVFKFLIFWLSPTERMLHIFLSRVVALYNGFQLAVHLVLEFISISAVIFRKNVARGQYIIPP